MQAITLKGQSLGSLKVSRPERREELLQRNNRNGCSVCLLAGRQGHSLCQLLVENLQGGKRTGTWPKRRFLIDSRGLPLTPLHQTTSDALSHSGMGSSGAGVCRYWAMSNGPVAR